MKSTHFPLEAVPELTGDWQALASAGDQITAWCSGLDMAAGEILQAWKGINADNYSAPESPAVEQSIPKIHPLLITIQSNVKGGGAALSEAAHTLKSLMETRQRLVARISRHNANADDYVNDVDPNGSDLKTLLQGVDRLRSDTAAFKAAVARADEELSAAVGRLRAPDPNLPMNIQAGVAAGNRAVATAEGPKAYAGARSERWEDADGLHMGAAAAAYAQLFSATAEAEYDSAYGKFSAGAGVTGMAEASASAGLLVADDGIHGQGKAEASAGVRAQANADYEVGVFSTGVGVNGFAGAEAQANGKFDVGLDGVGVAAGASAFAGAKASADATAALSGLSGTATADVRAGIGVDANVAASVSWAEVRYKVDAGLCLGVGAGVSFDVSIKPKEVLKDLGIPVPNPSEIVGLVQRNWPFKR